MHGVAGAMITSTDAKSSSTRARYQRRNFCARSTSAAGIIAPASRRSRTAGSKSFGRLRRRSRCKRRAFAGGDDIGCGAGARGFGNFDRCASRRAPWRPGRPLRRLRGIHCFWKYPPAMAIRKIADILRQQRRDRLGRPGRARRVIRVWPLHRVIGQREIADVARERTEMIEARDEGKRPCRGTAGRRSASVQKSRRTTTAPGSSRWCPIPAPAAPGRHQPRRRSRPTSRRSSASHHADCARVRHEYSRR